MADEYKPGQKVPRSGVYQVRHDDMHAQRHEVTCVYNEPFPPCHGCGHGVRYVLVRGAQHIRANEHLN